MAPAGFQAIRSARAFEEIAAQIRNELAAGRLKVGSRLPSERALSEQFGVSRNTLREALRSLEHAGLIRLQKAAGGGALIAALLLSSRWMMRVLQRVQALAPWMVALALAGLGWAPVLPVSLLCFVVIGFGVTFVSTATNAYLQQRLPAHLRGGMIALYLTSFNAVVPFGQMVAGALAERGGALLAYQVSSLALLACLACLYVPRWTAARHFETDATRL